MPYDDDRDPPGAAARALLDQLDAGDPLLPTGVDDPQLPDPPGTRSGRALRALAMLGGVASAGGIARQLEAQGGAPLTARQVREALRNADLQRLGGGYLALPTVTDPPLDRWLRGRLARLGPRAVDDLVADVLVRWPHGDAAAIRAWLHQDPPGVAVVSGVARLVEGWEDRGGRP